ncbi:MAG: hypothetical protein QGI34_10930, partial [Candidatus Latescibacteria bacterium]|nr:hypothetical protein [Candidatus Latescibacterota bacterium]
LPLPTASNFETMADLHTLNNHYQTGTFHKKAGWGILNSTFEFGVRALPMLSCWPASIYSTYIPVYNHSFL